MAPPTLLVQALVQFATAGSFAYVGSTLRRHPAATRDGRLATTAFVAWWWSMATYLAMLGVLALTGYAGFRYYPFYIGARVVMVPLLATAAWGIMTYVLYLYTGRRGVAGATAVYATFLALAFWFESFHDARGTVTIGNWSAGLTAPADPTLLTIVYAMFAIPLILSTLAYMSLLARVRDAVKRYRIAMVSGSILAWVAGGYAGASSGNALAQFVSVTLLGALAAAAVVLAYRPPRRLRAWLEGRDRAAGRSGERAAGPRLAPA